MREAIYTVTDSAGVVIRTGKVEAGNLDPDDYDVRPGDSFTVEFVEIPDAPPPSIETRVAVLETQMAAVLGTYFANINTGE